jgi:hypothetical protein
MSLAANNQTTGKISIKHGFYNKQAHTNEAMGNTTS